MVKKQKYALVIDDDPDFLRSLARIVEVQGLQVVTASNTQEARLRMRFQVFDIIITDIVMPKENGLQFLVNLHKNYESPTGDKTLPSIIVITGFVLNEALKSKLVKILGVELILSKPLSQELLIKFLNKKYPPEGVVQKHAYDAILINKFLKATIDIIQLNTTEAPRPGKAFIRTDGKALGEFTGIIELTSKTKKGFVALSFERSCCLQLARKLLFDESLEASDSIMRDVSGEMCNQVAGHAQAQFQKEGLRFEISTPTIVSGLQYRIDHKVKAPCVVIPFAWLDFKFFTQFVMTVVDDEEAEEVAHKETLNRGEVEMF